MTTSPALPPYVIITPVRDEERFILDTVESVLNQTHLPMAWVVVDDGSTDRTHEILRRRLQHTSWAVVVSTGSPARQLGSAEVLAFQRGLATLHGMACCQYIVKLDGDVRLPPDYFERVLTRMSADARWGIGSGVYLENTSGTWQPVDMPSYHAAGASKVVHRDCFDQIGGFVPRKGWDTVDEIRAAMLGWRTGHFDDIRFQHLKPEGAAMGSMRTHAFHGSIYYQTGGGLLFLLGKAVHRMLFARPFVLGGLALLCGYFGPLLARRERLVNHDEARYYRSMLRGRLKIRFSRLLASMSRRRLDRGAACAE